MIEAEIYKYKVKAMDLLLPNQSPITVDPNRVSDIEISKNYDADFFPIFRLILSVSRDMYFKIRDNKETIKFRIRLDTVKVNSNNVDQFSYLLFNDIFTAFIDDATPNFDKELDSKVKVLEDREQSESLRDFENSIELYLFNESHLGAAKTIINKIIKKGTMTDAIAYTMSSAGLKNILMEPLDNKESFDEIILPPTNTLQCLSYLENQFGFYKTFALLFFDLERIYLMSKKSGCNVWAKNESKKTVLNIYSNTTKTNFFSGGTTINGDYYINITREAITIGSKTMSRDAINGTNTLMINNKNGIVEDIDTASVTRGKGNYDIMVNKYDNKYLSEAIRNNSEDSYIIDIEVNEFKLDAFTPNKEFVLWFEDTGLTKTYGGIYRLSSSSIYLSKEGATYSVKGIFRFVKRMVGIKQ